MPRRRRLNRILSFCLPALCLASFGAGILLADDPPVPGSRDVKLWPPPDEKKDDAQKPFKRYRKDGWQYEAYRTNDPNAGVPWELIVTPDPENDEGWQVGDPVNGLPPWPQIGLNQMNQVQIRTRKSKSKANEPPPLVTLPVIQMPEFVWRSRFPESYTRVVGIHFHEYVSDDFARLLITIHKVPPDGPDGKPQEHYKGVPGTRLEATLLMPVMWHLDQSIVVRVDNMQVPQADQREKLTQFRADHEIGHADVSRQTFVRGLIGPQTFDVENCRGRRTKLAYYWKREIIGREWDVYRDGDEKLKTLRTTVALVPPTRWSKMLPIPPERVTQRHIDQFNDEVVDISAALAELDKKAQDEFHAHHGAFE